MKGPNVLKEDRAASPIHIINGLIRGFTHQKQAKKVDTDYFVFTGNTIDDVIKTIQNKAAKDAIVVDDLGLQIVDRLYHEGLKHITLILARLPKELFHFISDLIKRTFPNIKIDIKHIEEVDHMKTDLLISNPPYGKIGADTTKIIRAKIDYDEFINLEPGNDYFTNDNYKYIDLSIKPIVLGNNAFSDASQATTIAKISKQQNNLTQTGARLLISVQNKEEAVYKALSELWLNTESVGSLTFTRRRLKQDSAYFMFNSGGFDIAHGYFAVANGNDWTLSTLYNIFGEDAETLSGLPSSKIKGCLQFKKLIYSELGLKMVKLWFSSSPEGWGFGGKLGAGMFADIDYSDGLTWNNVFTKLDVSEDNQKVLIEAAEKFELNNKEKEICKIAKETL